MAGNNTILNTIALLSATITTYNPLPYNPGFSIKNVLSLAQSLPRYSWEYGTSAEAQLELFTPQFSVFGSNPFPIPALPAARVIALNYASSKIEFGSECGDVGQVGWRVYGCCTGDGGCAAHPNPTTVEWGDIPSSGRC